MNKSNSLIWINIIICLIVEYIGVWYHDEYLIFIGGLCALTNVLMLTKEDK